jgi:hypothetical protein
VRLRDHPTACATSALPRSLPILGDVYLSKPLQTWAKPPTLLDYSGLVAALQAGGRLFEPGTAHWRKPWFERDEWIRMPARIAQDARSRGDVRPARAMSRAQEAEVLAAVVGVDARLPRG